MIARLLFASALLVTALARAAETSSTAYSMARRTVTEMKASPEKDQLTADLARVSIRFGKSADARHRGRSYRLFRVASRVGARLRAILRRRRSPTPSYRPRAGSYPRSLQAAADLDGSAFPPAKPLTNVP